MEGKTEAQINWALGNKFPIVALCKICKEIVEHEVDEETGSLYHADCPKVEN